MKKIRATSLEAVHTHTHTHTHTIHLLNKKIEINFNIINKDSDNLNKF